jgi:hypothetical protein
MLVQVMSIDSASNSFYDSNNTSGCIPAAIICNAHGMKNDLHEELRQA